jgi:large subunit ribosomal protein L44e
MEIPKIIKIYCKKCNAHQEHKLKAYKAKKARTNAKGTRKNKAKHKSGYGGMAKHIKGVKKQNKKPVWVAECQICKQKTYFVIPKRMKKVDFKTQ